MGRRGSLQSGRPVRGAPSVAATTDAEATDQVTTAEKETVVGAVVTPSVVNKPWFRVTAVLGTLFVASAYLEKPLPGVCLKLAHAFAFSSWFGCSIWVLLLSPKIMFSSLGRQTFGKLQAKLFPQFFGFSVLCLTVLLGTQSWKDIPYILLAALASNVVNWLILEPLISNGAMERYALENAEVRDEEKIAALRKKTSSFHGMSSAVALISLCCAVAHGYKLTLMMSI